MGAPPVPDEATRDGRAPLEYKVRLTHVASINPEYDYFHNSCINWFSAVF